jgi:hypothetical protein
VVDELLDSGAMVFEGDAPLYLYRVAGVDRPVPAQPAADRLSKSDSDYWLSVRSQVIHALNERGLTIMSDKDRVWLHESHPAAANEPACISGHIYQGFCPSDTDPGSRDLECPACRKMVEAKPAADEWRDAVEDALSTVHMTANGSTPREAVAALLKVHASIALDQRLSSAADAQALRDAERYRWLRYRTKGLLEAAGAQYFAFPYRFDLPPVGDLMRGSVAQHLDNAIDAALGIDSKEAQK